MNFNFLNKYIMACTPCLNQDRQNIEKFHHLYKQDSAENTMMKYSTIKGA